MVKPMNQRDETLERRVDLLYAQMQQDDVRERVDSGRMSEMMQMFKEVETQLQSIKGNINNQDADIDKTDQRQHAVECLLNSVAEKVNQLEFLSRLNMSRSTSYFYNDGNDKGSMKDEE